MVPIYNGLELEGSLVIRSFLDRTPVLGIGIVYKDKSFLGTATLLLISRKGRFSRRAKGGAAGAPFFSTCYSTLS